MGDGVCRVPSGGAAAGGRAAPSFQAFWTCGSVLPGRLLCAGTVGLQGTGRLSEAWVLLLLLHLPLGCGAACWAPSDCW